MARKNLFGITQQEDGEFKSVTPLADRPLAGLRIPQKTNAAVGAISQSLEQINARAQRADDIEKQLSSGLTIIDLDTELIESSFISDRMEIDADKLNELKEQIKNQGQLVPILVRPHPADKGRYQVAYGHRRLAATKALGMPVRAVVRELTNDELVISQGQENNTRTDLSFIERCHFAWKLEMSDFSRDTIMAALNVDKTALSRLISLSLRLPDGMIEAIGPAPATGRIRWNELADILVDTAKSNKARKILKDESFQALNSDDRFLYLYNNLKSRSKKSTAEARTFKAGRVAVDISETARKLSISFDKRTGAGFAIYVEEQLGRLLKEYNNSTETTSGD